MKYFYIYCTLWIECYALYFMHFPHGSYVLHIFSCIVFHSLLIFHAFFSLSSILRIVSLHWLLNIEELYFMHSIPCIVVHPSYSLHFFHAFYSINLFICILLLYYLHICVCIEYYTFYSMYCIPFTVSHELYSLSNLLNVKN